MEEREAVFKKIGDDIRQRIVIEKMIPGDKLPSENELVKEFQVSRTTIQRALRYLEKQGIIRREKGKGSFVNIQKVQVEIFNFSGFSDYISRMGKEIVNKIVSQEIYEDDGKQMMKLKRLRGMKDDAGIVWLTLDQSIIGLSLFPDLENYDFEKESLYDVFRRDYGVFPQYSHLKAKAVISDSCHSTYFDLQDTTALVKIEGTVFDAQDNIVEEVSIVYNPITDFNFLVSV